ncbi:MAG: alpha/beta hydrolase [Anaerocolumna sp.]
MIGYIILCVFLALVILLIAVSWILSNVILKPEAIAYDKLYQREIEEGRLVDEIYQSWEKEDFNIRSRYGYNLSCQLINNDISKKQFLDPGNKLKIAIICHGYTCGKYSSMIYADMFLKKGITVLIYDHRNHGLSGRAYTTMGYYEKFDLQTVLDWCYSEYGPGLSIVTHGESMGGATVLSLHAIDGRVRATIADCSYSSLDGLIRHQLKKYYHLPAFPFLTLAKCIIRLRAGFWLEDVVPLAGAVQSHAPILFIHGLEDDYVPYSMSQAMYDAKPDKKEIYLAPNAKHAQSCQKNPVEYERVLNEFLEEYYF